jgi:hypothetical protein
LNDKKNLFIFLLYSMTTSSDERWSGSDHGHQNGRGHHMNMNMNMNMNMGLDNNSPSSGSNNWFSSLDDEGKKDIHKFEMRCEM